MGIGEAYAGGGELVMKLAGLRSLTFPLWEEINTIDLLEIHTDHPMLFPSIRELKALAEALALPIATLLPRIEAGLRPSVSKRIGCGRSSGTWLGAVLDFAAALSTYLLGPMEGLDERREATSGVRNALRTFLSELQDFDWERTREELRLEGDRVAEPVEDRVAEHVRKRQRRRPPGMKEDEITAQEVEDKYGIPRSTLQRWEDGRLAPLRKVENIVIYSQAAVEKVVCDRQTGRR